MDKNTGKEQEEWADEWQRKKTSRRRWRWRKPERIKEMEERQQSITQRAREREVSDELVLGGPPEAWANISRWDTSYNLLRPNTSQQTAAYSSAETNSRYAPCSMMPLLCQENHPPQKLFRKYEGAENGVKFSLVLKWFLNFACSAHQLHVIHGLISKHITFL